MSKGKKRLYIGPFNIYRQFEAKTEVKNTCGDSLVVQWLRLCLPMQGVQVRTLIRELRSHMPYGQKSKT